MKRWLPDRLYAAKPWVLVSVGALLAFGSTAWSLVVGNWSDLRGLLCGIGVAAGVAGGVILQLRQEYRSQSKWKRERDK
jgi:hypothetical protein